MLKHLWNSLVHRLQHTGRKTDALILFVSGMACAAALQPVNFFPVIFAAIPLMFFLVNKSLTTKGVFWRVWVFNFGYFMIGLYWINAALFIDIHNNWWVVPWALGSLPALMSFYAGVAAMIWHRLAWKGAPGLICFVVLWMAAEWVRGWALTGFPWNLWGYVWTAYLPVLQSVSLFGIYGLSFLTLLLTFLPVMLYRHGNVKTVRAFCAAVVLVFLGLISWGGGRLSRPTVYDQNAPLVRIVQPNIKQEIKWDREKVRENTIRTWSLTIKPFDKKPDVIVWPETTINLSTIEQVRLHQANIQNMIPAGTYLAMGVFEVEASPDGTIPSFFNRLSTYAHDGTRVGKYDKRHLVPFGEFLPFQKYWPVRPVAFSGGSTTAGPGLQTERVPGLPPFSPLICYEVLFSGDTVLEKDRPAWILNVTNDAWYGVTSGPYQHLALAQTRAVEEGLPLVRAANTGVSAMFDGKGRPVAELGLNELGVIDHLLPAPLHPTLFAIYGNKIFYGILAFFFVFAWVWQRRMITKVPMVR